ncbi:hypothetical protein [Nocardioides sp.]|uniref:hypothetical protein n=1 Tax=Nocardioides sp. TaxID=35761 RepID=UPI002C5A76EA|nr:hypothetical protein [Nocardioides sp.]HSX67221.1 hypothetical protein [Nocardioides sp.]
MRLVTWNEKDFPDLTPAQVRSDARAMAKLVRGGATIIGAQEIGDPSDLEALKAAFPGWRVIGGRPTPILLDPDRFEVLETWHVQTHEGKAGISPHRGYTAATVGVRRPRGLSAAFTVINTHYVSGAWTAGHRPDLAWRREKWNTHHRAIADAIALEHVHGRDVFVIGDMNRVSYDPATLAKGAYTLAKHGLDHIVYAPAVRPQVRKVTRRVIRRDLHTDHAPVVATFTFTGKDTTMPTPPWRLAKSLETLRTEVNNRWPTRNKASDGTIGNAEHASRDSDHNPWVKDGTMGVVTAIDLTDDEAVADVIARTLVARRDRRIKYVIFNRTIWRSYDKPGIPAWTPAPYSGVNAHLKHVHVSVQSDKARYDSTAPWGLTLTRVARARRLLKAALVRRPKDAAKIRTALEALKGLR